MRDNEKWRSRMAWAVMTLLVGAVFVILFFPSLRMVGFAILLGYVILVVGGIILSTVISHLRGDERIKTSGSNLLNQVFGGAAAASPDGAYQLIPILAAFLAPAVIIYVFAFMPLRALWRLAKRTIQSHAPRG